MTAQGVDVSRGNYDDWHNLQSLFSNNTLKASLNSKRIASSFISDYYTTTYPDFFRARFRPDSSVYWPISNSSLIAMQHALKNITSQGLRFKIHLTFTRSPRVNEESRVHTLERISYIDSVTANNILAATQTPGQKVMLAKF
jgi:hypothetical protein